jgi:hypothetical protein
MLRASFLPQRHFLKEKRSGYAESGGVLPATPGAWLYQTSGVLGSD